jgi:4-amino-4-deoxy-L-arabinose transferase-like glycosyltransferase
VRFVAVRGLPFIAAILVLKWALLLVLFPKHPDIVVSPDTRTYVRPALSLLRAGVYAKSPVDLSRPEVNRTPGYPILIAAVYAVVGERVLALAFVNTLLCAGTAVVLSATAARLFGSGAALWAAILFAIEPSNFHYSMMALSDAPFVFVLSLAIWAFVRAADRPGSVARWGAIGGLLAAAILIRPLPYFLVPPAGLVAGWAARKRTGSWARGAAAALALLLPSLLLVGGWQLRNLGRTGSASISQVQDANLYFFRSARVVAALEGTSVLAVQERFGWKEFIYRLGYAEDEASVFGARRYADLYPETSRLTDAELAASWRKKARAILAEHPGVALALILRDSVYFLFWPPALIWSFHLGLFSPSPVLIDAILSLHLPAAVRLLMADHQGVAFACAATIPLLAALYACAAWGIRETSRIPPLARAGLLSLAGYLFAVTVVSEGADDRLRIPLLLLVCLFASPTVARFFERPAHTALTAVPRSLSRSASREGVFRNLHQHRLASHALLAIHPERRGDDHLPPLHRHDL